MYIRSQDKKHKKIKKIGEKYGYSLKKYNFINEEVHNELIVLENKKNDRTVYISLLDYSYSTNSIRMEHHIMTNKFEHKMINEIYKILKVYKGKSLRCFKRRERR